MLLLSSNFIKLLASAIVVALALLPATQPAFTWIALGSLPFAIGLAAAFTIGSYGRLGLAVVGALVAWLGSSISIVINAVLFYIAYEKTTPGEEGGIVLPLTLVYVAIAFVVAALGSLVGGLLRNWFLGTPSTSSAQT